MSSDSDTTKLSFYWESPQMSNRNRELAFCVCRAAGRGRWCMLRNQAEESVSHPWVKSWALWLPVQKVTLPHFNILPFSRGLLYFFYKASYCHSSLCYCLTILKSEPVNHLVLSWNSNFYCILMPCQSSCSPFSTQDTSYLSLVSLPFHPHICSSSRSYINLLIALWIW